MRPREGREQLKATGWLDHLPPPAGWSLASTLRPHISEALASKLRPVRGVRSRARSWGGRSQTCFSRPVIWEEAPVLQSSPHPLTPHPPPPGEASWGPGVLSASSDRLWRGGWEGAFPAGPEAPGGSGSSDCSLHLAAGRVASKAGVPTHSPASCRDVMDAFLCLPNCLIFLPADSYKGTCTFCFCNGWCCGKRRAGREDYRISQKMFLGAVVSRFRLGSRMLPCASSSRSRS